MADYIDRQAAIAALREFAEECKGGTEAATAAAMAISVISRLQGPWVSVGDRLPPLCVPVLVTYLGYYDQSEVHPDDVATRVDDDMWLWWDGDLASCDEVVTVKITHWMPLPDAPGVEE